MIHIQILRQTFKKQLTNFQKIDQNYRFQGTVRFYDNSFFFFIFRNQMFFIAHHIGFL